LTEQHTKEGLSRAYLAAIAADAGVLLELHDAEFDYGVDATVQEVDVYDRRLFPSGVRIDVQLKASVDWSHRQSGVEYDLEARAYNDMVRRTRESRAAPLILALLCLPKTRSEWLACGTEELVSRKCCYWFAASGAETTNTSTHRILIPHAQQLTPRSLRAMLDHQRAGVFP